MNRRNFLKTMPAAGSSLLINQESEPNQEGVEILRENAIDAYKSYLVLSNQYGEIDENEFKSRLSEFQSEVELCDDLKALNEIQRSYVKLCHHMQSPQYRIRNGVSDNDIPAQIW